MSKNKMSKIKNNDILSLFFNLFTCYNNSKYLVCYDAEPY